MSSNTPATIRRCRRSSFIFFLLLATASGTLHGETDTRGENRARIEPSGFIYGGAIGLRQEIYADYDHRIIPLPVIGYRGEKLRVFGPFVNYEVARRDGFGFDLGLSPRFGGFDESDSDIFRGMDEREFSMDATLGATWQRDDWKINLQGLYDVLGRSDGREARLRLGRAFRAGRFILEPSLGLSYLDRRHVDYYYGVDDDEAAAFRPAYRGRSALNPTLGIGIFTPSLFGGLGRIGIENTWYDEPIVDSPLVEHDSGLSIFIAYSRFFDG